MPKRSLADLSQERWIRMCERLGLIVERGRGKGSHCIVLHPRDGTQYVIQRKLHKHLNAKIFKKLLEWGFADEQIWDALS